MKDVFKYTFLTIADIKKFLFIVLLISTFTLLESIPFIKTIAFLFEKLLYLSIGVLLIHILKRTPNENKFFEILTYQPFSTFTLHFIPSASGILMGIIIILTLFISFFIFILQFTSSLFILQNPHEVLIALSKAPYITKVLLGFYSVYLLFFSYIFLGKFGEALTKENFKDAFLATLSSVVDFKFWINSFNLKYMGIYFIWSLIISFFYVIITFSYIFYVYPIVLKNPDFSLIIIPILSSCTAILLYFTFFSAYFSYKTTTSF
ncbi:MAG: hypothetical protein ABGX26_04430 [Nautiliaceae bacterium]